MGGGPAGVGSGPLLERHELCLRPDPARVVVRPFRPATEPRDLNPTDRTRANHIVDRVLALRPEVAARHLEEVLENFQGRHRNLLATFEERADSMEEVFLDHAAFGMAQRQLVGAYFLHEYSFEAAALFNPSLVAHPDQRGVAPGARRVVLSLRAVGEGHVSSLTFRSGMVEADGTVGFDPAVRLASVASLRKSVGSGMASDCYELLFDPSQDISERVIFPVTEAQANGIEDARFVEFDAGGRREYYATYTAYSGKAIRSELLETRDFVSFRMRPLTGAAARNKGMALFPRRINGRYAMIGRQDNENLHLIYSDDLCHWEEGVLLLQPREPWEFVQIGNCGSPIELEEGWLLLTHGVGPVRRYSIGAVLLDRVDPSRVLARTMEPILRPEPSERAGYVPNVVYTCGAMRHGERIILPYAVSDSYTQFASMRIATLLSALRA